LFADVFDFYQTPSALLDWVAVFSVAALMFACLGSEAGYAVAGLYLVGLLIAGTFLDHLKLAPELLIWSL
jgi:hypothetical protein